MSIRALCRDPRRAVVLILVLWIVIVLTIMAYSLIFQATSEATVTGLRKRELQADMLARAGIAKAIVDLRNDLIFSTDDDIPRFDAEGDVWARPEEGKDEVVLGNDDNAHYSVRVYDEEGLFNLNRMSASNMMLLQTIIERIGYDEEDAEIVAAAIVDWRDSDTTPALPNAPHTEEGMAYAMLRLEDLGQRGRVRDEDIQPIIFRNENFLTVDELLEVYGVTPDLYFGPGTPEAEYYTQKFGGPEGERFHIEERTRHRRPVNEERPLGLRDYFTVYGEGRLNINTAPHHVLAALAEAAGDTNGDQVADRVLRIRRGGRRDNFDNSNAFQEQQDIMADNDVGSMVAAASNLYPVGVRSSVFRIIAEGKVGEVSSVKEVVAARSLEVLIRDETFEAADRARQRRDNQSGRWERRQNRDDPSQVVYPFVRIVQAYHH